MIKQLITELGKITTDQDELYELREVYKEISINENQLEESRSNWSRLRFYYCCYVDRTVFENLAYTRITLDECETGLKQYLEKKREE